VEGTYERGNETSGSIKWLGNSLVPAVLSVFQEGVIAMKLISKLLSHSFTFLIIQLVSVLIFVIFSCYPVILCS
jgi:hypothetical protein